MDGTEEQTTTMVGVEHIKRHALIDRAYHWLMGISVLILLGTAFLPIIGIQFDWLGLHWATGIVLSCLVVFHIVRALGWQNKMAMVIDFTNIKNGWRILVRSLTKAGAVHG